jgi:predicted DCC family thiol-disulfide oxidoreductase YuxK
MCADFQPWHTEGVGARAQAISADQLVVLYDGTCGLCHGLVRFLIARDRRDRFRFAPLQSQLGRERVEAHGGDPEVLGTFYLLLGFGTDQERALTRGRAALHALSRLGGPWRLAGALRILPGFVLDLGYAVIARLRYRLFGRRELCSLPAPEERQKFIAEV